MDASGAPVDLLRGCDLPAAWAGQRQWRILEIGSGPALNFLAAWRAWKDDPQRPRLLHFVSIAASPVAAADLLQGAAGHPALAPLAGELATQWFGLVPGFHRLVFDGGRVLLTLCIGDTRSLVREQDFAADSIFLGRCGRPHEAAAWDLYTTKALARLCRRGTTLAVQAPVRRMAPDLLRCGFALAAPGAVPGDDPNPDGPLLRAVFEPAWTPRALRPAAPPAAGRCVVIGAGLAGAAAAASLARRGWQVRVFDAAPGPAAGASAVPAALLCPDHSPDDNLLSRLSRSGVRITLQQAQALLREGQDWQAGGVLEHRIGARSAVPDGARCSTSAPAAQWSRPADGEHKRLALLAAAAPALWHEHAGWIKPAALVAAWLAQPGIAWSGGVHVERIMKHPAGWQLLDAAGRELAQTELVVVAAALGSGPLLGAVLPLQPVRGQVSWAAQQGGQNLPPFPVNGLGYFLAGVPLGDRSAWLCGSTFGRGESGLEARAIDHRENAGKLAKLLPAVAVQLAPAFAGPALQAWAGVRCASADRRPLVGEIEPGLWLSTAMGSRGLTFAGLGAELIAARLHGEPLPLPRKLASAVGLQRGKCLQPASQGPE